MHTARGAGEGVQYSAEEGFGVDGGRDEGGGDDRERTA